MSTSIHDYGRAEPPEGAETWTTETLQRDFEVLAFHAPYVSVRRKSDGAKGTMEFTHTPRLYFDFRPRGGE